MNEVKRTIEYVVEVIRLMPHQFTMGDSEKFIALLNERLDEILEIHKALEQEPTIGQLFSCEEVEELRKKIWKQVEREPKTDVLDKIRAEIEAYEADCILADDSKECKECDKIVFGSIYRIIDKYREEQE